MRNANRAVNVAMSPSQPETFGSLTPILWHEIVPAQYKATGNGAGFLGKLYEPDSLIENDVVHIRELWNEPERCQERVKCTSIGRGEFHP